MSEHFEPHMGPLTEFSGTPRYFAVRDGELLVAETDHGLEFPATPLDGRQHVLGSLGDRPYVAIDVNGGPPPSSVTAIGLRELHGQVPDEDWAIASRAVQIVGWDRNHRFCGRCGTETEPQPTERARRCPRCGLSVFPRLSPAVIVLVTRGEHEQQALLARGRNRRSTNYSTLAGFVEVGESLEEAVRREVREETGVEVREISYFGSQPWPFPGQLMVGFRARHAGGEIRIQPSEIVDARWLTADEVEHMRTPRGGFSIAGWLIDGWIAEQRARNLRPTGVFEHPDSQ